MLNSVKQQDCNLFRKGPKMIKKRFLLNNENIDDLLNTIDSVKVKEYYTVINSCKKIKYTNFDNRYFKEKTIGSGKKQKSSKKTISEKKFDKNKKCSIGKVIKKRIYLFNDKNKSVVHSYGKSFGNLNILTLKFNSAKRVEKFKQSNLYNFVSEDITSIDSFNETSLALLGNPLTLNYNVYKLFKEIEVNQSFNIKNIIHSDMKVDDALRVKLYELYLNLNRLSSDIMNGESKNQFVAYKKNIDKVYTILLEFKEYFDLDLHSRVIANIKFIQSRCDVQKDLKPIKKSLHIIKDCLGEKKSTLFFNNFDKNITKKAEPFKKFLQTREYSIIMKQLELLIKESSYESFNSTHYKSIKMILDKKIKNSYRKSLKVIDNKFDCLDYESFIKIDNQLEKLMILIGEFSFLYNEKDFFRFKKLLLAVKSSFDKYIMTLDTNTIMQENIDAPDSIKCLKNSFYENSDELIKKIKKDIKRYKRTKYLFV